jgi:peptidoglycan hydrolase CwlO-like protein
MRRFLKVSLSIAIISFFFLYTPLIKSLTFSLECKPGFTYSSQQELEEIKALCEAKVTELRNKSSTLASQIQYMDTQVYLTTLKIQATEQKIVDTEREIDTLSAKIDGLDESLNHLSKILLGRIVAGYKTQSVSVINLFLDSGNANDFLNKVKYQKTTQDNNQKLLVQVQESKLNAEEQKKTREKKKSDLDQLKLDLDAQKTALSNQKVQKQKLLADTQNDEVTYQQILAKARAQLSAFSSFAKSSGVANTIAPNGLGSGSDGNYYSQRDSRWASMIIGNSSSDCNGHPCSVLEAGCLVSSIAMVSKKKGSDTNPGVIASNTDYFSANTAYMKFTTPSGGRRQISLSEVDTQLQQGNYVIAGVNYGGCRSNSDHFVVLTKKEGNDYKMHDPLFGPDLNFSSHYAQVCWAEVLN